MYCALKNFTLTAVVYFIKVKGKTVRKFFSQRSNLSNKEKQPES